MDIVVYGLETCGKCSYVKKRLEEANCSFQVVVDEQEIVNAGISEIPTTIIDGEKYGFSQMLGWLKEIQRRT